MVEDDITPVVLFKAVLSTYEGQGAIYVPPSLNKQILLAETGTGHRLWASGRIVCLLPQWFPAGVNST